MAGQNKKPKGSGPQVAGSIFPLTNRIFWIPGAKPNHSLLLGHPTASDFLIQQDFFSRWRFFLLSVIVSRGTPEFLASGLGTKKFWSESVETDEEGL